MLAWLPYSEATGVSRTGNVQLFPGSTVYPHATAPLHEVITRYDPDVISPPIECGRMLSGVTNNKGSGNTAVARDPGCSLREHAEGSA